MKEYGDCSIIFALKDKVGVLAKVLKLFQDHQTNLRYIELRSSKQITDNYEFMVVFDGQYDARKAIEKLKTESSYLEVITCEKEGKPSSTKPWFPRRIYDLDTSCDNNLMYGAGFQRFIIS